MRTTTVILIRGIRSLRLIILLLLLWLSTARETIAQNFWQQTNGPHGGIVGVFAINPTTQDIFAVTVTGGVFRSTNNGDSWTAVNTGLTSQEVRALAINSSGHIFAGAYGHGVFRSTNNGDSWTAVNTGLTNTDVRAFAINASGHIFAGTIFNGGGVFRSTNNGNSWTAVNTGLTILMSSLLPSIRVGIFFRGLLAAGCFAPRITATVGPRSILV